MPLLYGLDYGEKKMPEFINIADFDSGNGKTYRQMNNEKTHSFGLGVLVELDNGVRLFVAKHTRDCDGTLLYSLTPEYNEDTEYLKTIKWTHGYCEYGMKAVITPK
tara:strand:- start:32 stop:349 length:318 start_codon:yes stop_codon:yes gene_type:complete